MKIKHSLAGIIFATFNIWSLPASADTFENFKQWLSSSWGEVYQDGKVHKFRGCHRPSFVPVNLVGKISGLGIYGNLYDGPLAFTIFEEKFLAISSYSEPLTGSNVSFEQQHQGMIKALRPQMLTDNNGNAYLNLAAEIPGILFPRRLVPINNSQFKLVAFPDKQSESGDGRDYYFQRCGNF